MHFICEMVPSYYLTPLRKIVAQKLSQHGLKQLEIAQVLGVSQPVVSSYLKEDAILKSPLITRDSFKEFSEMITKQILEGASNQLTLMELICQECQQYRTAGPLCDVHRRNTPMDFPIDCTICFPSQEQVDVFDRKLKTTKELYDAAQLLIGYNTQFGELIPEIGCQFVTIIEDSQKLEDIVGFPGRIIKVKGLGKVVSYPEFNQGSTLAEILLHFRNRGSNRRAIISLKNTPQLLQKVKTGYHIIQTHEADLNWSRTLMKISREDILKAQIIADSGGIGFEPLIYVLGDSPLNIVNFIKILF